MNKKSLYILPLLAIGFLSIVNPSCNCKKDDPVPFNDGCYPPAVAEILIKKCATAGCHNTISKEAAGGLDLSSWEAMFQGTRNGAVTVPYRSDMSTLFYFTNTDTALGIVQVPTMPYNGTPLSQAEVLTIRDWIDAGAPNCQGQIKWSDNPNRKKFYVANQGCDIVGVHDAATKLVMRYVDVGSSPLIESPHMIQISPDKQFWYCISLSGSTLQKFRTSDDKFISEVDINQGIQGFWNTFVVSPDGSKAWAVDFSSLGRIAYVDLDNMQFKLMYTDPGIFTNPHGSYMHPSGNYIYVTGQIGNKIFKWDVTDPMAPQYQEIIINNSGGASADPHEVALSPDGSKYFITCQNRDEVRVFDAATDTFITAIPTADFPLELSFSSKHNYLFISCETGNAVTVIDYNTLTHIKDITVGFLPHGIAVDDVKDQVYVANRNLELAGGPPPHHSSTCGGWNGYLTIIDMNTLNLVPGFKMEMSVDPYSVRVKN